MVAITEFHSDYELFDTDEQENEELDLTFLEAIDAGESFFAFNTHYFESLDSLAPQPAFVPTLHESTFEKPLHHAVWTSSAWPQTRKHFPA
jgi:hypothetical protein